MRSIRFGAAGAAIGGTFAMAAGATPHPVIFQKSLIEDSGQRAASQYMRAFRDPDFEKFVESIGFEAFFDKSFRNHVDLDSWRSSPRRRSASTSPNGRSRAR